MRRESLRRHGILDQVAETDTVSLFRDVAPGSDQQGKIARGRRLAASEKGSGILPPPERNVTSPSSASAKTKKPRTKEEDILESYKGIGRAEEQFKKVRAPPQE